MSIQNVLFVDDSKPLVQLFTDYMSKKKHKYGFITASNGEEALKILKSGIIVLVILDIQMPVMDGLQFLAELHNRKIWLPVIIMTGSDMEISEKKFGEYGIVDYLKKPVFFEDLDKRINEILTRTENKDMISGISIFGILQVLEMEKKTGIMSLKIGNQEGKIFFKEGKVADIEAGGLSVDEAIREFVKPDMEIKKINIEYINHLRENKINKSLTQMVLEAAKEWDEQKKPQ
jgi:DNA-binding response OmpR family regulator